MKNIDDLIYEIEKVKQEILYSPNTEETRTLLQIKIQKLYDEAYNLKIINEEEQVYVRTMAHDPKVLDIYTLPKKRGFNATQ